MNTWHETDFSTTSTLIVLKYYKVLKFAAFIIIIFIHCRILVMNLCIRDVRTRLLDSKQRQHELHHLKMKIEAEKTTQEDNHLSD